MKTLSIHILMAVLLVVSACQKETIEPQTTQAQTRQQLNKKASCREYFYFYTTSKTELGTAHTDRIIVGFSKTMTDAAKTQLLLKNKNITSVASFNENTVTDFAVVNLKNGLKCYNVEEVLDELRKETAVLYANPFLQIGAGTQPLVVSTTDEFLITLEDESNVSLLQNLANTTNTQVVSDLGFGSYILATTANTNGSAIDMANFFNTQTGVSYAEPNFYFVF